MSTIPTITKHTIRTFVGEQNFLKGQQYMHDGAIVDPVKQGKQESDWRRKHYGGLLLALEANLLSDEEFLRIGRETKSIQEVVTRLLELDRVDEAIQDASQANGWQSVKLADLFVQYGQDAAVERMMYEKAQQERYTIYADWLKNHHLAKNNLAAALEMAQLIFHKRP